MNIKQAKEQIQSAMRAYFSKDEFGGYVIPVEKQRPIFLMGPPGIGKSRTPMILSLVGMVGLRQLFLATVTRLTDNITVIFFSYPVGWGTTALLLLFYFLLVRKSIHLKD